MIERFNHSRAIYYDFFSKVFLYENLKDNQKALHNQIQIIIQEPITDEKHYLKIQECIKEDFSKLTQEYTNLFLLPFASPISLYLSHYKNGCIGGEALLYVKDLLKNSKFFINRVVSSENEDHIGILCLFMKFLLLQKQNEKSDLVFRDCIYPMAPLIIKDILNNPLSQHYKDIAKILEAFISFEEEVVS